uniref:Nuclear autoantigenic sperm protein n=1 Tax=Athene cunicularia TaxID=194338 RepID=A0A663M7T4_ATHCN
MEEELAAPSTSTDKTDSMDVDGESKKLLGLGQKHLVMGNIPAAVNAFQEAASLLGKKYGETADECAEAFFYYGKSLLELARYANRFRRSNKCSRSSTFLIETEESEEEDKENEKAEDDKENELTVEDKESEEDEIGNLELAWEMLELAKIIYKRQETKEGQLHAAQAHLKLGEVSIESENYMQAIEEFQACLALQQKYLEAHDRLLAESHYQLALAYHYNSQFDEAVLQFGKSVEVIDKRMAMLTERIKKAESGSPEDEQEIEELKGLLPEIKEKIEDSKESQKSSRVAKLALKATLVGTTSGFAQSEDSGSVSTIPVRKAADGASQCVTDISHLTIYNFVFRGNQRRRFHRGTMKLRNLNQNRLSMVVVLMLPPVEMRLQKKWKRRWAAEAGVCAICTGFTACWSPQGAPDEMGNIPPLAGCMLCLTLGWEVTSCGDVDPWGGTETCSECWSWAELQHRAFPQGIFFSTSGF